MLFSDSVAHIISQPSMSGKNWQKLEEQHVQRILFSQQVKCVSILCWNLI